MAVMRQVMASPGSILKPHRPLKTRKGIDDGN